MWRYLLAVSATYLLSGCSAPPADEPALSWVITQQEHLDRDENYQKKQIEVLSEIADTLKQTSAKPEPAQKDEAVRVSPFTENDLIDPPKWNDEAVAAEPETRCDCSDCNCVDCVCSEGGECLCTDCEKADEALATEAPPVDEWKVCKFSATWCGPCRVYPVSRLNVPHYEVDVSDKAQWKRFGITALPSFDITKNGFTVYRYRPNRRSPYPPTPEQINDKIAELKGGTALQAPAAAFVEKTIVEKVPVTKMVKSKVPGSGWNEGRSACGNRGCSMCYPQYQLQPVTVFEEREKQIKVPVLQKTSFPSDAGQAPTPAAEIKEALRALRLNADDVLADFGCGDGRVLIAAAVTYECSGVGVEIDPTVAQRARDNVEAAGLSSKIKIITGDAREFEPEEHGVTKGYVYLYEDLISELRSSLETLQVVASPFHPIEGLDTRKEGNIFVYEKPLKAVSSVEWTPAALRTLPVEVPPAVKRAIKSPDSIWTSNQDTSQWQLKSDGSLMSVYRVGYNMALNKHLTETGSPNNEHPWRHSGGFDDCDVSVLQMYHVPGKIRVRRVKEEVPGFRANSLSTAKWIGEYPENTVAAEFVRDNKTKSVVALRYRLKSEGDWITEQVDLGPMPANYQRVNNCVDCHEDITKHANELDSTQEWYTTVRGLEPGGPFNFPLVVRSGNGMDGKGSINPAIAHLLSFEN